MLNKEKRKLVLSSCSYCGLPLEKRDIHLKKHLVHFCSKSCQNNYQKTGSWKSCGFCGLLVWRKKSEILKSKSQHTFCGRSCATSFNNKFKSYTKHPGYKNGAGSYRARALRHYGFFCQNPQCDLNSRGVPIPEFMLDVHHKDGDRQNNELHNLSVLCVWCHTKLTRLKWSGYSDQT